MKKIVIFLFCSWIILACLSVLYNSVKTVSEVREWAPLSDSQKRHKIFGELYDFYVIVNNHIPKDAKIIFYPKDEMSFYLGRYYFYPRIIIRAKNEEHIKNLSNMDVYTYVVSFSELKLHTFSLIASESGGFVYKRK